MTNELREASLKAYVKRLVAQPLILTEEDKIRFGLTTENEEYIEEENGIQRKITIYAPWADED